MFVWGHVCKLCTGPIMVQYWSTIVQVLFTKIDLFFLSFLFLQVSGELALPGNEFPQFVATAFVTIVVLGSMLYIGVVFCSELNIKVPMCLVRCFADAKTALEKQKEKQGISGNIDDGDIELSSNPLMRSKEDNDRIKAAKDEADRHKKMAEESAAHASAMGAQQAEMIKNLRTMKKKANQKGSGRKKIRKRANKKKDKNNFGPQSLTPGASNEMDEGIEMANIAMNMNTASTGDTINPVSGIEIPVTRETKSKDKQKNRKKKGRQQNKPSKMSLLSSISTKEHDLGMDLFDPTRNGIGFINPLKSGVGGAGGAGGAGGVVGDDVSKSIVDEEPAQNVDVFTDEATGKKYSVDRTSGMSSWLEE